MHIIVCMKQVPDPEGPKEAFQINEEEMRVEPSGIPPVMSLFDENALEAALRIKDARAGDARITILSMGKKVSKAVMMRALAAGADELVKVDDPLLDSAFQDKYSTSIALEKAIQKIGQYDLILMGRQAADWNAGMTGVFLGGTMNIPCITLAQKITVDSDYLHVERIIPDGYEVVETVLPAIVMVSNEIGELRYPAMKERREAKKKRVTAWNAVDIGFNSISAPKLTLKRLFSPNLKSTSCRIVGGDTPEDAGRALAKILFEEKVI